MARVSKKTDKLKAYSYAGLPLAKVSDFSFDLQHDKSGKHINDLRYLLKHHDELLAARRLSPLRKTPLQIRIADTRKKLWNTGQSVALSPKARPKNIVTAHNVLLKISGTKEFPTQVQSSKMAPTEEEDKLLMSYLPRFRAAVDPLELKAWPAKRSASRVKLAETLEALKHAKQKFEIEP